MKNHHLDTPYSIGHYNHEAHDCENAIHRTFITTQTFERDWKSLGLDDEDQRRLELMILENPEPAPVIAGTGGLRKLRFAFKHRGKSGSVRVCYVDFILEETVYLIAAYAKKDQTNLTAAEKKQIASVILELKHNLRAKNN